MRHLILGRYIRWTISVRPLPEWIGKFQLAVLRPGSLLCIPASSVHSIYSVKKSVMLSGEYLFVEDLRLAAYSWLDSLATGYRNSTLNNRIDYVLLNQLGAFVNVLVFEKYRIFVCCVLDRLSNHRATVQTSYRFSDQVNP